MAELHNPRVAFLASGGGTTASAYAKSVHEGVVQHEIGLVISSSETAGILDEVKRWNREYGFDTEAVVINKRTHPGGPQARGQTLEESETICTLLDDGRFDLAAALGYMIIANNPFIETYGYVRGVHGSMYKARAINTHPGPLPLTADTWGINTSRMALDAFRRGEIDRSKHTVHVLEAGVDKGPIIVAHDVPILPDDTAETLNQRTQWIEKATIAYASDKFLREQREYNQAA